MNWTKPRGEARLDAIVGDATSAPWDGPVWEYTTITMKPTDTERLNALGEAGWELVSMTPSLVAGTSAGGVDAVFRRAKRTLDTVGENSG